MGKRGSLACSGRDFAFTEKRPVFDFKRVSRCMFYSDVMILLDCSELGRLLLYH